MRQIRKSNYWQIFELKSSYTCVMIRILCYTEIEVCQYSTTNVQLGHFENQCVKLFELVS